MKIFSGEHVCRREGLLSGWEATPIIFGFLSKREAISCKLRVNFILFLLPDLYMFHETILIKIGNSEQGCCEQTWISLRTWRTWFEGPSFWTKAQAKN